MKPTVVLVLLAAALACASAPPPVNHHLLRAEMQATSGRLDPEAKVGLGRLIVAPYLTGSQGIVVETEPGVVRAARQHQWAEPMEAGIRAFVRAEVGRALGYPLTGSYLDRPDWDYRVDLAVDRLHGTMEGTAVLEARYRVTANAQPGRDGDYYFARSKPLPREGYKGVVDAEIALLKELSASIANALREAIQAD